MYICVDFDGTCVTHEFPKVGRDIGAESVLKELVNNGHDLILFTMRSDLKGGESPEFPSESGGQYLTDAVNWFKERDIPLFGINTNPIQSKWTNSPKAYGHIYIDDAALGMWNIEVDHDRPYVDWKRVRQYLVTNGYIDNVNMEIK